MGKPPKLAAVAAKAKGSEDVDPEDDIEMTFFEHLGELRTRLVRSLYAILPCFAVVWLFKEKVLDWLSRPLVAAWHELYQHPPELHFAHPIDPVVGYLQISFVGGLLLASPWVFWQVWQFIAPGLYRSERRLALPFVLFSTAFFVGGAAFGYFIVLPPTFQMFLGYGGQLPGSDLVVEPTLMLGEYLDFVVRMLLAFGVTFEVPVVISFLAFAGLVNWKQLLGFFRWWVVIAAVVAAVLTPPDVGSQMLMLVPLVVLYLLSVALAWIFGPKVPPAEPASDADHD